MMRILMIFVTLVSAASGLVYRKNGTYMIGAILPLTYDNGNGKCTTILSEGVAIAESIVLAFRDIELSSEFTSLRKNNITFGYDIRDSCNSRNTERMLAYEMTTEAFNYRTNKSKVESVKVVISEFTKRSVKLLTLLSTENIVQVSYYKENVRLKRDPAISPYVYKNLISVYPELSKKMLAVVDLVKEFRFQHVYMVATDNMEGRRTLKLLSKELSANHICQSKNLFLNKSNIQTVLSTILENRRIRVVIIDALKDLEVELYKEAKKQKVFDIIFISTQNWDSHPELIKPYASVVEGMISVEDRKHMTSFRDDLGNRKLPFYDSPWLTELFLALGGEKDCLSNNRRPSCVAVETSVQKELVKYAEISIYAYESVYVIANAVKKSEKQKLSLLEATKGLQFRIPLMPRNVIAFSDRYCVETSDFMLFSSQGNSADKFQSQWLGNWKEGKIQLRNLLIRTNEIRWKNGITDTPSSVCSETCSPSFRRSFFDGKCCWSCVKCPNGTVSNVSNADNCITCGTLTVPHPDQSRCVNYELMYFKWFGPIGSLLIVLMVVSVSLLIFSLGIFSQKTSHELVISSNYNSLSFYLFGCLLLTLAPIPLLIKPTTESCASYIAIFNIAITMCLGILLSRSAAIGGMFDENGELVKGTLGNYPRFVVVGIIVALQIIINIVGLKLEPPATIHNETDRWNGRYHECSSWASQTFWIGFVYNVVISIIGNSLSCRSTKIENHSQELKHVLLTHLLFYTIGIIELIIFYRVVDEDLAGGQGITCVLFALAFYFFYIWPKIYIILFRSSGNKAIERPLLGKDDDGELHLTTAIHASAGFKHQGIVQMKVRDEE